MTTSTEHEKHGTLMQGYIQTPLLRPNQRRNQRPHLRQRPHRPLPLNRLQRLRLTQLQRRLAVTEVRLRQNRNLPLILSLRQTRHLARLQRRRHRLMARVAKYTSRYSDK